MSPLSSYRHLFQLAGPGYVAIAFVGRLPLAMSQLGTLLLVANATGSYGAGGATAGSLALANAVGAPIAGAVADRVGQRRVVLVQALTGAAGLVVIVGLSLADVPWGWQALAAAATGFALPQIGPLARVRWRPIASARAEQSGNDRRLMDAAFSYEGAADETSFVLGPALVGIGAALFNPAAALLFAAGTLAVFGSLFALDGTALLVRGLATTAGSVRAGRLLTPALAALGGAQLLIGAFFGSVQTGTTALARSHGMLGAAGLLHALLGVGSVAAGIAAASLPSRFRYPSRLVVFAAALAALSLPLLAVGSLGALAVALTVLGTAVAPFMITTFTLAERISPADRSGTAMTLLAGVTGLGWALGAAVAGRSADLSGPRGAFAVTVVSAALAFVLAAATRRRLLAADRLGHEAAALHARTASRA